MGVDFAKAFGCIKGSLRSGRSVTESMQYLIDQCDADYPHKDWRKFQQLPWNEFEHLSDWIEKPLRLEPPNTFLRGLWFGIFNPIRGRNPTADFYISGSDRFDADPDSIEWAVGPNWSPESRYAYSVVMDSICKLAYSDDGLENNAEYPLCLGYTSFAILDLLNRIDPKLVLEAVGTVGIAAGFDSGDFILLGEFTRDGLAPL